MAYMTQDKPVQSVRFRVLRDIVDQWVGQLSEYARKSISGIDVNELAAWIDDDLDERLYVERCTDRMGETRCTLEAGHEGAHRNGQAMWEVIDPGLAAEMMRASGRRQADPTFATGGVVYDSRTAARSDNEWRQETTTKPNTALYQVEGLDPVRPAVLENEPDPARLGVEDPDADVPLQDRKVDALPNVCGQMSSHDTWCLHAYGHEDDHEDWFGHRWPR